HRREVTRRGRSDGFGRGPAPARRPAVAGSGRPPRGPSADRGPRDRRPLSARQRAIYRRRRLAVSGLGLILGGVLTLGVPGAHALISGLVAPDTPAAPVAAEALDPSETPVRLDIPTAGISVPLSGAGLTEDGEINPPQGEVTWYTGHDRATPGRLGTAVIA